MFNEGLNHCENYQKILKKGLMRFVISNPQAFTPGYISLEGYKTMPKYS